MEKFIIEVSPAAERDLRELKVKEINFNKLVSTIDKLSLNPRPYGVRKIKGFDRTYRIRFSSYRVIYNIYDKDRKIIILRIVKRNESTYKFKSTLAGHSERC